MTLNRILLFAAGLAGLCGVALSAVAYHTANPQLDAAAKILLGHAPLLVLLPLLADKPNYPGPLLRIAGLIAIVGLILFCGDLTLRSFASFSLFPYAAPTGGTTLMLAWILTGISAFWIRK